MGHICRRTARSQAVGNTRRVTLFNGTDVFVGMSELKRKSYLIVAGAFMILGTMAILGANSTEGLTLVNIVLVTAVFGAPGLLLISKATRMYQGEPETGELLTMLTVGATGTVGLLVVVISASFGEYLAAGMSLLIFGIPIAIALAIEDRRRSPDDSEMMELA